MSDNSIRRVKDLLVGACESLQAGHRDIATNLTDVILDELAKIQPEDIELGFALINSEPATEVIAADDFEELSDEVAHVNFRSLIRNMVATAQ
jgi:hypothetical protein